MWPFSSWFGASCTAAPKKTTSSAAWPNSVEALAEVLLRLERPTAKCLPPAEAWLGERFVDHSVLQGALRQVARNDAECWRLMAALADDSPGCGAAISALLGLAVGDSVGGPLEFLPVDATFDESDTTRPCVVRGHRDGDGRLIYRHAYNRFQLKPGQWTDDTSMALCLADSLLVKNGYDGGDLRVRWHMWWFHGYCNAFRYDERRYGRSSVGLGGNVAKSLADVEFQARRGAVPPIYGSASNDAGNGSAMRLAPVPIAYFAQPREAMKMAILQSRASHPSCDAAACCAFMAYFIAQAIAEHKRTATGGPAPHSDPKGFIGQMVDGFLNSGFEDMEEYQSMAGCGRAEGLQRIRALLTCQPYTLKEANWDWKAKEPQIPQAVTARLRDRRYNGHPIIDTYWGAYCMDGLAMAMWGLWHSTSFSESVMRVVNLLGDADTTGALCGQLAGALYGWHGLAGDGWGRVRLNELQRWDPFAEIGIRAALLYHYGPLQVLQVELHQKEGHPSVRVFDRPTEDGERRTLGEIASGSRVWQLARERDFAQVIGQKDGKAICGWVGIKNVVRVSEEPEGLEENTGGSFEAEMPPVERSPAYPLRTVRPPDTGSSRRSLSAEPLPMGSRGSRGL